jgi:hypothetical protein
VIVSADPFPNLGCHDSHNGIDTRVVFRGAPEHLNPQGSFLEVHRLSVQGLLDDVAQKRRVLPTLSEAGAGHDALQLLANSGAFLLGVGHPAQGLGATVLAVCTCVHEATPGDCITVTGYVHQDPLGFFGTF